MLPSRRRALLASLAAISAMALAPAVLSPVLAQTPPGAYPSRLVKVVVAWSPGGATDLLARTVAVELTRPPSRCWPQDR